MINSDSVFNRTYTDQPLLSASAYNLLIGICLTWGLLVTWSIVSNVSPEAIANTAHPVIAGILCLASALTGTWLFTSSEKPALSLLGYHMIIAPFGLALSLACSQVPPEIIVQAVEITGLTTVTMMILGTLFPSVFARIGRTLFIALILSVLIEVGFMLFYGHTPEILDWVFVAVFCGYIGYDWGRANSIPKTYDNAIDSAASIYIDVINLFVRLLRILARK